MLLRQGNSSHWLLTFALNYVPFVLALIFVLWPPAWTRPAPDGKQTRRRALPKTLAWCLAGSAAVLALGHGFYNDWAMRVTLPLSIMLAVALTKVLLGGMKWPYLAVLLAVLLISSASSLAQLTRSVLGPTNCKRYGTYALGDMGELTPQYEGRSDSLSVPIPGPIAMTLLRSILTPTHALEPELRPARALLGQRDKNDLNSRWIDDLR